MTTKNEHTPGKWVVNRDETEVHSESLQLVIARCIEYNGVDPKRSVSRQTQKANASLIARAPELLKEVELLQERVKLSDAVYLNNITLEQQQLKLQERVKRLDFERRELRQLLIRAQMYIQNRNKDLDNEIKSILTKE